MVKVAGLHVEVVRLQVAELRARRSQAVVRQCDRLSVMQLRAHPGREDVLMVRRVALAGTHRLLCRGRPTGEQRDVRPLAALRQGVVRFQAIATSAQIGGGSRGELIAGGVV